jgi:hypothetical protein
MKKTAFQFLCVLLLASHAVGQSNYLTWSTNSDNTITITGMSYTDVPNLLIPPTINGLPVTVIGTSAISADKHLGSVDFPTSMTNIEADAFEGCTALSLIYFSGPPPAADPTAFVSSPNASAVYAPGAAGWGSNFDGLNTIEGSFGYSTNSDGTFGHNVLFRAECCYSSCEHQRTNCYDHC